MTVETVTSRTAAPFYARASGGLRHDGEPPLARVHPLGAHRLPVLLRQRAEAQLAQDAARAELVHALARERYPAALAAPVA